MQLEADIPQQQKQGDNREMIDFDNILEQRIKLGKAQVMVFISCAFLWFADGAELLVVGFIMPVIQKEWELTDGEINWLGSFVFLAWAVGALYVGQVSDKIGRRKPMIIGTLGQFLSAVLSAFSVNYITLIFCRSAFGFFLGLTSPISVTNFSEMFPKKNRGRYFTAASSFFVFGEIITVFMAYMCLDSIDSGNWRLLLLQTSLPGLAAFLFILSQVKESPRYLLLCTNCYDRAFKIIDKLIYYNHKNDNLYEVLKIKEWEKEKVIKWAEAAKFEQNKSKAQQKHNQKNQILAPFLQLFQKEYKDTTVKLMFMWFSLSIVYYGIIYILPSTLIKMHGSEDYQEKVTDETTEPENTDDFQGILLTILVEIPLSIFAIYIIENKKFGRKNSMTLAYALCAMFSLIVFFYSKPNDLFFVFVSGAKLSIGFCFAIIAPFTAEIYSTNMRAAGCGFNNAVCRMGGVLMPWLSYLFFYISNTGPFLVYFIVTCISFIACYKLSADTTNLQLDKFLDVKKEKHEQKQIKQMIKQNKKHHQDDTISVGSKLSQDQFLQPKNQLQHTINKNEIIEHNQNFQNQAKISSGVTIPEEEYPENMQMELNNEKQNDTNIINNNDNNNGMIKQKSTDKSQENNEVLVFDQLGEPDVIKKQSEFEQQEDMEQIQINFSKDSNSSKNNSNLQDECLNNQTVNLQNNQNSEGYKTYEQKPDDFQNN